MKERGSENLWKDKKKLKKERDFVTKRKRKDITNSKLFNAYIDIIFRICIPSIYTLYQKLYRNR